MEKPVCKDAGQPYGYPAPSAIEGESAIKKRRFKALRALQFDRFPRRVAAAATTVKAYPDTARFSTMARFPEHAGTQPVFPAD